MRFTSIAIAALAATLSAPALAQVQVTEWMYSGAGGEFIEFSNLGSTPVDFSGWSYDDDSATPGVFDLSGFGSVAPGESVIITEDNADTFRSAWSLPSGVQVLGGYTNNIGRADAIHLFDAAGGIVDAFAYGDAVYAGTVRTQNASGTPLTQAALASPTVTTDWVLAAVGDGFGSHASANGDIGNPGLLLAPVPEPESWAMLLAGVALVGRLARRRA
jgi:predicted extracellular nuclease